MHKDPKLKGATISINGHTDGVGGDAFNRRLSERRAGMIKEYLVDNFQLSASNCAPSATVSRG
jgi:outer membrane protein OmpA-like peptidoglycan-associated protein